MRRRDFIAGCGAASLLVIEAARSQKLPTVGFLGTGTPETQRLWLEALVKRLQELNWINGRTLTLDVRWAAGRAELYQEFADDFVRRKVDVIVTSGSAVPTLMKATATIPIVFGVDGDPVGRGLVTSLSRPGGNVTGMSNQAPDVAGKRAELLRELLPEFRRLAVIGNAAFASYMQEVQELQAVGNKLGFEVVSAPIRRPDDIASAFAAIIGKVDAIYLAGDALVTSQQRQINARALEARLPIVSVTEGYARTGALFSYGPNFPDLHRRAADYVDRILRGAKPGDLPVEQPIKFDLVFNLATAKRLGIVIPPTLLALADEVIE